jgi:tRNA pseudouridine38-40 synthase
VFSNSSSIIITTNMTRDHSTTASAGQAVAAAAPIVAAAADSLPQQAIEQQPEKQQPEPKPSPDAQHDNADDDDNVEKQSAKRQKVENNNDGKPNKKSEKARKKNNTRRSNTNNNSASINNKSNSNSTSNNPHQLGTDKPGKDVHPGSYAHAAQRTLFNVHLAEFDNETLQQEGSDGDNDKKNPVEHRIKRKVALLLGYVGTKFGGFQINEGQQTLQGELELAMFQNRLLSKDNFGYPFKYGWSTSGRTDKGVHACAQVVSCKMEMTLAQEEDLNLVRAALNETLPVDIRVLDVVRVSRAFCAHTQRDKVRYQYMIPSFCLQNSSLVHEIFEKTLTNHLSPRPFASSSSSLDIDDNDDDSPPEEQPPEEEALQSVQESSSSSRPPRRRDYVNPLSPDEVTRLQDLLQVRSYRVTPDELNRLKQALQMYQGTHSFHNLAKGVKAKEARASRYIISFHVEDPIVLDGMEWIPTQVLGQSFLLHQIRKMVCLALDVARRDEATVPLQATMSRALSPQTTDMRMGVAPAQGLYLDMSFYTGYNQRKNQRQARGAPQLPDLDWSYGTDNNSNAAYVKDKNEKKNELLAADTAAVAGAAAAARWKEFRNGTVMKHVVSQELQEGNFVKHLYIQEFAFDAVKHYQVQQHQVKEESLKEE